MGKERELVVRPLKGWIRKRPGSWELWSPKHETSERGWDIEARSSSEYWVIEAKYTDGPSVGWFGGLIMAPLVKRDLHLSKAKEGRLQPSVCWAIGMSQDRMSAVFQKILDYLCARPDFWEMYGKWLRVKRVFFVVEGTRVLCISYKGLLRAAARYDNANNGVEVDLKIRRVVAEASVKGKLDR